MKLKPETPEEKALKYMQEELCYWQKEKQCDVADEEYCDQRISDYSIAVKAIELLMKLNNFIESEVRDETG